MRVLDSWEFSNFYRKFSKGGVNFFENYFLLARICHNFNLDETRNAKSALKYSLEASGPKKVIYGI